MASSTGSRSGKKNTSASSRTRTGSGKGNARGSRTASARAKTSQESAIANEIILIGVFALSILLFLCNFGLIGPVGDAVSSCMFGIFGMIAYVVPVLAFVGLAFGISNRGSRFAAVKIGASVTLLLLAGVILELISGRVASMDGYSVSQLYTGSSVNRNGGGVLSGSIAYLLNHFMGMVGAVILVMVLVIICLVLITEKSFVGGVRRGGRKVYESAKNDARLRRERAQQRREEEEERRLHREQEEEERILRMDKKVSGVIPDPRIPAQEEKPVNEPGAGARKKSEFQFRQDPSWRPDSGKMPAAGEVSADRPQEDSGRKGPGNQSMGSILNFDKIRIRSGSAQNGEQKPEAGQEAQVSEKKEPKADPLAGIYADSDVFSDMKPVSPVHILSRPMNGAEGALAAVPWDEMIDGLRAGSDIYGEDPYKIKPVAETPFGKTPYDEKLLNEEPLDEEPLDEEPLDEEPLDEEPLDEEPIEEEPIEETRFKEEPFIKEPFDRETAEKTSADPDTEGSETSRDDWKKLEANAETADSKDEYREKEAERITAQSARNKGQNKEKTYHFPPISLLRQVEGADRADAERELRDTAAKLQQTLATFGVKVSITDISQGPSVTRYELQPEQGVKVSKIVGLSDDIKLNLAATDIRIEAPIPGKAAIGIEVPNKVNSAVGLRELLESREFREYPSKIAFAVGKDIAGQVVVSDIEKMPHMLIAGATGSGKSVCINTLIMSILYKAKPDEVKLILIDPKVVELSVYNGIPHLLIPVVTDPKQASGALHWGVAEMLDRYQKFAEMNVRNLKGYNKKAEEMRRKGAEGAPAVLPQIVIIVDELADLMMVCPGEVEESICRLAQLARAAGIHLIIATQRPSVDVITGLIKANMPSRVAFSVSSGVDSRTILDMVGAEKLLGKGDMLFYPQGYPKPVRIQGAFVSDGEVSDVVDFLKNQVIGNIYDEQILEKVRTQETAAAQGGGAEAGMPERDPYFEQAGRFIIDKDKASIGMLQRVFKIGFNRAARIMDQLADAGVVGEEEGTKPRKILMSEEQFEQYLEEYL